MKDKASLNQFYFSKSIFMGGEAILAFVYKQGEMATHSIILPWEIP